MNWDYVFTAIFGYARRTSVMRHLTALIFFITGMLLSGFSGAEPRKEIVYWGEGYGPDTKGLEATIKEFEHRNPQYKVKVLSMGAGGMNPQKLMTSIVGNVAPDVIYQDRFTISDWAKRKAFRPLDDLIARDTGRDPYTPDLSRFVPATVAEATYEGKLFGIPYGADTRVLYYNKEVFREEAENLRKAGLDPTRPPRTWSEVLAYSKVLTKFDKNKRLIRAGFLPNYGNSWLYLFAFQNNASFISPDGRKCTLYSPESEQALQFMVEGYDLVGGYEEAEKFRNSFQSGELDAFYTGQVAMKIDGDWILPNFLRFAPGLEFGVDYPPVPDDRYYRRGRFSQEKDRFITWAGGFCYAIPNGSHNVEGAWKLIKWMASTEARVLMFTAQADWEKRRGREFVPRILANNDANLQSFELLKPRDPSVAAALKLHIEVAQVARIRPVTFVGQVLWNEHIRAIERACLKKLSPKEALLDGQKVVQKDLDAFFSQEKYPVLDMRLPLYLGIALVLAGAVAGLVFFRKQKLGALRRHEAYWGYALISPWVLGFVIFVLGPMVASIFFSFTQYDVLSPARWVGFKNYVDIFATDQEKIKSSFSNVLYLAGFGVPLGIVTGILVALLLNVATRGMRVYRTIFYLPSIVPTVAGTILWLVILSPDPDRGLINALWLNHITPTFGVTPPGWASVESWAKPSLIIMGLWGAGGGMVLWLAGLKGVPQTLYEAASIDGANPVKQFFAITLPQLSPLILFSTVMGFIGAMQEFDRVYVVSNGENAGPNDSMLTPVFHLFTNGFNYFKMGYASALAWLIFAVILMITLLQMKLSKRWVHSEAEK